MKKLTELDANKEFQREAFRGVEVGAGAQWWNSDRGDAGAEHQQAGFAERRAPRSYVAD